ncbi:MAG: pantothenate kinase [Clostridia bacterium]|nr:pantothenate kinase [Clostridia bacterium]
MSDTSRTIVIGIDVGGSTTKIVGFRCDGDERRLIEPLFVRANDPVTAGYGAFGNFLDRNGIALTQIKKVMMTGVGSSFLGKNLYGLPSVSVPEFNSIGLGGLYLSGLSDCLVVSMGTGTAFVHAKRSEAITYLGGTGVGGGTLMGLSRLLLKVDTIEHIIELADAGDLADIDLRIADMTRKNTMSGMPSDMTAANFGKVSDIATKGDIAKGILNMVFETVGVSAIFAARACGVRDIVLTGNLTRFPFCHGKYAEFNRMYPDVAFHIPDRAQFATVIGTALYGTGIDAVQDLEKTDD